MTIRRVAVIGAGLMGAGIAQVAASSGAAVDLCDTKQELLDAGKQRIEKSLSRFVKAGKLTEETKADIVSRIGYCLSLEAAVPEAEYVIEAVTERLDVKLSLFETLDRLARPDVILSTNTSQLSVTHIASATQRPERVIGTHFFNPPPMMNLIEIITAEQTSAETLDATLALARQFGKETVVVKDSQGFVTSRVIYATILEAARCYQEGVASKEDIDKACRLGLGFPMGPLELVDLVGLDTFRNAMFGMVEAYGDRFNPPQHFKKMVEAGKFGQKSGEGYYTYPRGK